MNPEQRKVRGDAKLERITPQQHERLRDWLDRENRTYAEVVQLIRAEFSLSVGKTAVACFWQRHVLPRRYHQVAEDAGEVADLPETKFSEASLKLVRLHAYNALASSEPDLKTAARLLETVRSADRLALARERFAFAQRRAAARDEQAAEKRQAAEAEKAAPCDYTFSSRPMPSFPSGSPQLRIPNPMIIEPPEPLTTTAIPHPMPSKAPETAPGRVAAPAPLVAANDPRPPNQGSQSEGTVSRPTPSQAQPPEPQSSV